MLAMYLLAIFGLMAAVISSFSYMGQRTTMQLIQYREAATREFFSTAADVLVNNTTIQNLQLTGITACKGETLATTDPRSLLCRAEVQQLANWDMKNGITDPWMSPVDGVVVTNRMGIGPGVMGPVTAFAFISPGPDRALSPNLTTTLANLKLAATAGTAQVRDVLRLAADDDSDDIVMTYSNLLGQMNRWEYVENAIKRIADASQGYYMQQFYDYSDEIKTYMQQQLAAGRTAAELVQDPYNKGWKNLNDTTYPGKPALFATETSNNNVYALGVDEEYAIITGSVPAGTSLRVSTTVYSVSSTDYPTARDGMTIRVTNNGSPWGDASGNINYRYDYKMNY